MKKTDRDRTSSSRKRGKRQAEGAEAKPARVGDASHPAGKTSAPFRSWIWNLLACGVLLVLAGIVYSNSFQSGWVLDNRHIIQLDPRNKQATMENLKLIWKNDYWWPRSVSGLYRPIVSTSYWLNWSVFGNGNHAGESDQVVGFHWMNLLAHGINAILVYVLMFKLLGRRGAAFFTAALFAVHPVATEAVTNIVGRADEFAAMSFLGCTLLYIRSTVAKGFRKAMWLVGLMTVFAAGCFSKESAAAFVAIPIFYDGIYLWGSESYNGRRLKSILLDWLGYLAMAPPLIAMWFAHTAILRETIAPEPVFVDNPILRYVWNGSTSWSGNLQHWIYGRITACSVALKALWTLIWPMQLSSDYSYNQIRLFEGRLASIEDAAAVLSLLFVTGTVALAVWCYRRHPAVSFFIFFYWIAYGPTSNFLLLISSIRADRFLYLPLIAYCALLVLGVEILVRRIGASLEFDRGIFKRPWPRLAPHAALLLILVLYGVRAYNRNFDWRSDTTLAESAIAASPGSFRGYQELAFAYYETDPVNKVDRIMELGETGVGILDPLPNNENSSRPYLDLGIYYGLKGETVATRNGDGSVLMNDKTRTWYEKSAQVLERASEIDRAANDGNRERERKRGKTDIPDAGLQEVYKYLGMAYARLGMDAKSLEAFQYMRHLDPQDPEAYAQIGSAEIALGHVQNAVVSLLQCVILDPERIDAWQSLEDIYSQINHEPIPAVEIRDAHPQFRIDNKLVRQHLQYAYQEFITIARSSNRPEMARDMHDTAVNSYHFNPELFDDASSRTVERPVPPNPVFHTFGKKLHQEPLQHAASG